MIICKCAACGQEGPLSAGGKILHTCSSNQDDIVIRVVKDIKLSARETVEFKMFLQMMQNRRQVGGLRYGPIDRRKKYMTRLSKELKAYRKDGNAEQLLNIAVYAFLEFYAAENKKFHFDNTVDSVTRKEID